MSSILFYRTRKSKILRKKIFRKKLHPQKNGPSGAPGDNSEIVNIFVAVGGFCRKTSKIWSGEKFLFSEKNFTVPKKNWKGGPFGIFQHPFCRKTAKKLKGGPFEEKKIPEKSLTVPKKIGRGDPLVSPGMVCYAGKQEKSFWFSSLDQIVQFGAIIFCRTFVELFWSVRVDRKKRVTIIVAFHFMKRRLKKEKPL